MANRYPAGVCSTTVLAVCSSGSCAARASAAADSLRGDNKITKTTKGAGKLSIDRATVDEIVADVSQIKAMLQR